MSNNLPAVFSFNSHDVRTTTRDGEPWFVAKDICDVLNIKNVTQALERLDDDERSMLDIGRQGGTNIINESGLFALIIRSDKPEAKVFRKWVTSEVLPTIRTTGGYGTHLLIDDPVINRRILQLQIIEKTQELIELKRNYYSMKRITSIKLPFGALTGIIHQNGTTIADWSFKHGFSEGRIRMQSMRGGLTADVMQALQADGFISGGAV